ncbi:MAG: hypothetical protein EPO36_09325 [Chloroflexota bacterium]|nr:MAG: hypothetical protein EPO36_09325 [Chloroflexota bacterium]
MGVAGRHIAAGRRDDAALGAAAGLSHDEARIPCRFARGRHGGFALRPGYPDLGHRLGGRRHPRRRHGKEKTPRQDEHHASPPPCYLVHARPSFPCGGRRWMGGTLAAAAYRALIRAASIRRPGDDGDVPADGYALIDAGDGRRLERFGDFVTDRPSPAAAEPRRAPERWADAAVYHPGSGWWSPDGTALDEVGHAVEIEGLTIEVRPAAGGQVGLFPEHLANAAWLRRAIGRRLGIDRPALPGNAAPAGDPPEVLNLFAYTGLATLVAAAAGAHVVHVDASRPAVAWARRNAELSGLAERPIRWIVDDALAFVRREARRGRRYAGLILDPPSYGHRGRGGRAGWQLEGGLVELLDACAGVVGPDAFCLLTAHTPGWDPDRLAMTLATSTDADARDIEALALGLEAQSGAVLRLGAAARFDPLRGDGR